MRKLLLALTALLLCTGSMLAQAQKVITGTVKDETGGLLPGVSIQVKGTSTGTITDGSGYFSLNVPESAQFLIFRLIGMADREVAIGSNNTFSIILSPSASAIDEVVIVGYGGGKKVGNVVGAVTRVSGKEIQNRPSPNAFDALQGRVSGLQVFTSSGEPSQVSSLRLHGVGSLGASSTPLIIMDGVPIDPATVLTLNPQDFENVTVLKDASATSIYGSRAANGVIVITTKTGKLGVDPVVTVNGQYGVSNMIDNKYFNNFMNSKELTDFWVATGYRRRGQVDTLLANFPHNTRWDKVYYKENVPTYQTDLSVSGGGGKTTYYISGGYVHQEGLAYRSNYDKYTMRSNLNSQIKSWLRMGLNLGGGYDKRQTNPYGTNSTNRGLALLAPPFYSPYDKDGNELEYITGWDRYAPKYLADNIRSNANRLQLNVSGYAEITPLENLTIKTQAGIEAFDYRTSSVQLPTYRGSLYNGNASESMARTVTRTITNTVEYRFKLNGGHNFTALAGQEYIDYGYETFGASSAGHTDDALLLLANGPNNRNVSSGKTEYAYLSFFGRLEYNWNNKYYLDASLRQDQSSRFGPDNRTAHFWSIGGMWKMKEEAFLHDVSWLDYLDLRVSHGTSGNSSFNTTADENYLSYALVSAGSYEGQPAWNLSTPGYPGLSWESQRNTSVGASFGLFNKARAEVVFYNRGTSNMLINVPFPYTSGFSQVTSNVGSLKNMGIDVDISVDVYKTKKAYITPRVSFNYNKNKVTELFQGKQYWIIPNTGVSWAINEPVSYFYPVFAGINSQSGLPEWYLPNADNIASPQKDPSKVTSVFNEAGLQQSTGINRYPPFNGGFGLDAGYNGFYLQADFSFSQGKYLINNDRYFFENPNQFQGFNQSKAILDYWKQPGDVARFPKYGVQFTQFDSRLIENASFLRLKGLTIGYNFKEGLLKNKARWAKGASLFVTGRNLLTFTKYTGPDPEVDANLTLGVNPNTKQYAVGATIRL